MDISDIFRAAGILEAADLDLLQLVFEKTHLPEDTDLDRETRAAALIRIFSTGARSEDELLDSLGYSVGQ